MCNRDGPTLDNLFAESRYDRTIASQYISKTSRNETSPTLKLTLFKCDSKRLNINFSQTLGTAHDIRRIDGFIGRDHNHFLDIVAETLVGYIPRTVDIDKNSLTRIFLHKRYMLIRGSMKHNLRLIFIKCPPHTVKLTDISYNRHKVKIREALFKFQTYVMGRSLSIVK